MNDRPYDAPAPTPVVTLSRPCRWLAPLGAGVAVWFLLTACAATAGGPPSAEDAESDPAATVALPDVAGLRAAEALAALGAAGLTIKDDHQGSERVAAGNAVRTIPPAGSPVAVGSTVTLVLSTGSARDPGSSASALADAVEANPDAFVGIFFDDDGPVVVFNRGVDPEQWRDRLGTLTSAPYRVKQCSRTRAELEAVQSAIARRDWAPRANTVPFGMRLDPATCTVLVTTDQLTAAQADQLRERFGDAVTVDTAGHPERR